jgi:hypothetical protein
MDGKAKKLFLLSGLSQQNYEFTAGETRKAALVDGEIEIDQPLSGYVKPGIHQPQHRNGKEIAERKAKPSN